MNNKSEKIRSPKLLAKKRGNWFVHGAQTSRLNFGYLPSSHFEGNLL
jgi:hypothetical protein